MTKLLNKIPATGAIPARLTAQIKEYDRKHPMWACMATPEEIELVNTIKAGLA